MKYVSSELKSVPHLNHDELKFKGNGLSEDMAVNRAVPVEPTYTYRVLGLRSCCGVRLASSPMSRAESA